MMVRKMKVLLAAALSLSLVLGVVVPGYGRTEPPTTPRLATLASAPAQPLAQDDDADEGLIRGVVYRDRDNDGICPESGETGVSGVPIRLASGDGETVLFLQTGENGTFSLIAASLGTWFITAEPDDERITSEQPLEVLLTEAQPTATGVRFCLSSPTVAPTPTPVQMMPEAGAPAPAAPPLGSALLMVAVVGAGLVGLGVVLRRREES
ncbi:MAG: SdrD B-like domain-containing protein [Candidatus Promineifilaceae bacterium]|nr:SdrD B-like domain-containing protein [Candidatus Promineifilaceae bacterium]